MALQQLVNQFAKGDRHARRDVFQYAALLGVDLHAKEAIEEALGIDAQAIVDAHLRRHLPTSAEASPEVHVKAPPDLVDDDVPKVTPEQAATDIPARPPPTKHADRARFDENGVALPATESKVYPGADRARCREKKQAGS